MRHQKYLKKQLKNRTLELENNFNPINLSINDLDKLKKKKKTKQITFAQNTCYNWYDWLINEIPEPIKKPSTG